jgi:hypothetical protein
MEQNDADRSGTFPQAHAEQWHRAGAGRRGPAVRCRSEAVGSEFGGTRTGKEPWPSSSGGVAMTKPKRSSF